MSPMLGFACQDDQKGYSFVIPNAVPQTSEVLLLEFSNTLSNLVGRQPESVEPVRVVVQPVSGDTDRFLFLQPATLD